MSMPTETIKLLRSLIAYSSVSSTSNVAITEFIAQLLSGLRFQTETSTYVDPNGVEKANLIACFHPMHSNAVKPQDNRSLAYFCHTDVVPADAWTGPDGDPFQAVVVDDRVYGRGACDMKGSLATMIQAFCETPKESIHSPIWIVCTADEEVGFEGAKHLVKTSAAYREIVAAQPLSIIGEPTSLGVVHAHKGITGFRITSRGRAAHSSTSLGVNANLAMIPMLQTLSDLYQQTIDDPKYHDSRFDPPTLSWNFGFSDHCSAVNITPGRCDAWVCLRTMPEIDGEDLISQAKQKAESLGLAFNRFEGGAPVWVDIDSLCVKAMSEIAGGDARTVCYSTDGGQFSELENRVIIGPGNIAQAHTSDEWISIDQLVKGVNVFKNAITRWCCQ